MADIYTVYVSVNGEAASISFEFDETAVELAQVLDDAGYDPTVIDQTASHQEGDWVEIEY